MTADHFSLGCSLVAAALSLMTWAIGGFGFVTVAEAAPLTCALAFAANALSIYRIIQMRRLALRWFYTACLMALPEGDG